MASTDEERKKEYLNKLNDLKAQIDNHLSILGAQQQKTSAENEKKKAEADEAWKKLEEKADDIIKRGLAGYETWISQMLTINSMAMELSDVIKKENLLGKVISHFINKGNIPIGKLQKEANEIIKEDLIPHKVRLEALKKVASKAGVEVSEEVADKDATRPDAEHEAADDAAQTSSSPR